LILGKKSADARHKVGQDEVPPTEPASVLPPMTAIERGELRPLWPGSDHDAEGLSDEIIDFWLAYSEAPDESWKSHQDSISSYVQRDAIWLFRREAGNEAGGTGNRALFQRNISS
jgi:hypothetical protein